MGRVNQVRISESVKFFKDKILKRYNFDEYSNINDGCVFWGMYRDEDFNYLKNHKGKKIVVWRGSDAMNSAKYSKQILELDNIIHYSISSFTYNSLKKNKIQSILKPIRPTDIYKNPAPRGNSIYFYHGSGKDSAKKFYGGDLLSEIKKNVPYRIIVAGHQTYNETQLNEIYRKCFLGLRLTEHDGLPNTVCELGLMGRNCIHNGDLPNCIKYNNIDDIIFNINKEYHLRNFDSSEIVNQVYDYLNIGDDWLII